nr:Serine rich adhesin for platelets [Hymenolepis microstoma]
MGGNQSRTSSKTPSSRSEKKFSSPELSDKTLSLEAFVAEMVRQLVDQKVDEIVREERWNKSPRSGTHSDSLKTQTTFKKSENGLEVLNSNHEFFQTALAACDEKINDPNGDQADSLLSDSEFSTSHSMHSSSPSSSSNEDLSEAHIPCGIPADQIIGLIVNVPSRMVPFFNEALQFFWNLRINSEPGTFERELAKAIYPPRFNNSCVEIEDIELCRNANRMGFINRPLFFDYVREVIQRIYEGEDEEIQMNRDPVINSDRYRLWLGTKRPTSMVLLERIVRMKLEENFGINLTLSEKERMTPPPPAPVIKDLQRLPKLTQWTIQRKGWLDQHLEVEMRADEPNWMNYRPFEKSVLDSLTAKILVEAFNEVCDRCVRKLEKEIYEEKLQLTDGDLLKEAVEESVVDNDHRRRHSSSISELPS